MTRRSALLTASASMITIPAALDVTATSVARGTSAQKVRKFCLFQSEYVQHIFDDLVLLDH